MNITNILIRVLLGLMAALYNRRESKRAYLKSTDGWINFSIGFRTEDGSVTAALAFRDGRVSVCGSIPEGADSIIIFKDRKTVMEAINLPPNELILFLIKGKMRLEGSMVYANLFNYYVSILLYKKHKRMGEKIKKEREKQKLEDSRAGATTPAPAEKKVREGMLRAPSVDPGVKHLTDPFLAGYSIADFPRLKRFLDDHFMTKPEICPERAQLMTRWFRENGFETQKDGSEWVPELRQAGAYRYMMENRKPIIRKNDLVAGTSTTKDIGVIIYPEAHGGMIWSELNNVQDRELNPYNISEET